MAPRRGGPSVRSDARGRFHARRVGRLIAPLDETSLAAAVAELTAIDGDLAAIVERYGLPPLWARAPGFGTLLHIVLEQQVSLTSAQAAFDRLLAATDPLTPGRFLTLSDSELLGIGFSRQKARYGRELAARLDAGALDLDGLIDLDDAAVRATLEAIPGIGHWTSTIYLMMVLGRPDGWPVGDIALATAVGEVKRLGRRPGPDELTAIGEAWRPWRSVAARLFWHDYLSRRGRPG